MQRPISHSDRELEIHTADQIHTLYTPPGPLLGRYLTPQAQEHIVIDAVSPNPCHAHYLGCMCAHVCVLSRHVSLD